MSERIPGVLLVYFHPQQQDAATISEHVSSFRRYSRYPVWELNTDLGFPAALDGMKFSAIILHYSLFGYRPFLLPPRFMTYLKRRDVGYKIAFFQDEYRCWPEREAFINGCAIDSIYTLVEPDHFDATYRKRTSPRKLTHTLTGYVGDDMLAAAARFARPSAERSIDVGYRARPLPFYLGRGGREKTDIASEFVARAGGMGLKLDIATRESARLYGDDWYRFVGDCRAVLGVEAGCSVFDIDDVVQPAHDRMLAEDPELDFETFAEAVLAPHEDRIPYRTISPRHFEAAAFRTCQILFEGSYSGILEPMEHYIPLAKDFSNFERVMELFRDDDARRRITDNAHRDLIASGDYHYRRFIASVDEELAAAGMPERIDGRLRASVTRQLERDHARRALWTRARYRWAAGFPGKGALQRVLRPIRRRLQRPPA